MILKAQINSDYQNLHKYFEKMHTVLDEVREEEKNIKPEVYDGGTDVIPNSYAKISHFILPDMVINIYSYLEFWLKKICQNYRQSFTLGCDDIKGKNDLHKYHKYFTKYIGLVLKADNEYEQLNRLREVRNFYVHHGGHIRKKKQEIDTLFFIGGKEVEGLHTRFISLKKDGKNQPNDEVWGMIIVEKKYVDNQLKNAQEYLLKICIEMERKTEDIE